MKLKDAIQRVQSLYSKGVQSDDSRLSPRHIYSALLSIRALLISQRVNKRQKIGSWAYQTLHCVELVKAKPYECPCLPAIGCVIMRTKFPLPTPISGLIEGHMIQSVTSLEGSIIFSETTWKNKKYKSGSKYTSSKPDYYIRDGYLYITTKKGPTAITITGLFEDPIEAEKYPGICDDGCVDSNDCPECISPLDKDFPIEKDLEKTLIEMTYQEVVERFSQGREDTRNNSMDNKE